MMKWLGALWFACLLQRIYAEDDLPIVEIPQGKLQPVLMESAFDKHKIYAFLGIPYGKVVKRFSLAEPAGPWEGVLKADKDGPECFQWDSARHQSIGQEDCLYLNIYTRQLPPANPGPPLVFFHGGDWLTGSGSSRWYGPRYWLDQDIVLVTVNYRLGAFGFLSTGDVDAPGNLGIQDQILALEWLNNNIQFFGGMTSHLTIMGEGTGAASVHFLQLTHKAKNLFERAISQSGTAFCPWAMVPETFNNTLLLAEHLACPLQPASKTLQCLREVPADEIARATHHLTGQLSVSSPFGPVVDSYSADGVLPKSLSELMTDNNFRHVPWIVGINRDEGADIAYSLLTDPARLTALNSRFAELAPQLLGFAQSAADPAATSEKIREQYFGNRPIGDSTAKQLVELLTDRLFLHCTEKAAWWHSFFSTQRVYVYQWHLKDRLGFKDLTQPAQDTDKHWHPGNPRFSGRSTEHDLGVSHKDELLLMFSNEAAPLYDPKHPLVREIRDIINMWATFTKTGDPTPDLFGMDYGVWREYWEYYYPHDQHYMIIDREWQTVQELRPHAISFWDSLGLREHVFKGTLKVRDEL